ncbi:MAG: NAD(P)-dependent oxidoreductase [Rickettsiales bacterium]|nr:NAD(P)-dependent oxidoreductase [Pseudomonadota bacterium]MDA0966760.1 NAD(P)-dependent oxidoreductase [Pseudomonadota bacterium]MDG4543432.1 NAD(P)-dependent oxidoreductase [Rickettsiales bacterium]MDG4546174.1 NAD(P)-dependent oxidoreductase [Rickettsiales bacterium]MDG4547647.1 NAD(P)-dependent oxidoreductase [Rickettsiales bacterium]
MLKQVVVTGASGYIGRELTNRLLKDDFHVSIIARKNSNLSYLPSDDKSVSITHYDGSLSSLEPAFINKDISAVFHLAAWSKLSHCKDDIDTIIDSNVRFGTHLLECTTEYNCPSFINTSSFSVYNDNDTYKPQALYSASKKAFEDIIEYYTYSGELNAITLILCDVYGVGDNRKKIFSLLKEACINKAELDTTAGEQFICPVYIDDVISAYLKSYDLSQSSISNNNHKKYFVAGDKIQLKEIINKYVTIAGYDIKKINMGTLQYAAKQIMNPYIGEILPDWQQTVSIDEGLRKIIND